MTTHGIVGVYEGPNKAAWRAVPIGSDAYPSGTGFTLHLNYYRLFERDLSRLVKRVIDERSEGWCSIAWKNLMFPAIVFPKDSLQLMELALHYEAASRQAAAMGQAEQAVYTLYLSRLIRMLPSVYEPTDWNYTINHSTPIEMYWAEWSYLFNVSNDTVDVFWGRPSDGLGWTVWLNERPSLALWERIEATLPDMKRLNQIACDETGIE